MGTRFPTRNNKLVGSSCDFSSIAPLFIVAALNLRCWGFCGCAVCAFVSLRLQSLADVFYALVGGFSRNAENNMRPVDPRVDSIRFRRLSCSPDPPIPLFKA